MAQHPSLQENFSELQEAVQSYINARLNYWKITLIEKTARAGTYLFSSVLVLFSALFVFLLLSFAFSYWFADHHGTMTQGLLISAGAFIVIVAIVYLLRRKLFANSIVKNIASIIYEDEDNPDK